MLAFILSICDPAYRDQIENLVNTYHDDMIIYAKHILKRAGRSSYEYDAEDVVQNLYMRLVKYCHSIKFDECPEAMRAYLKKILKNEAMTFLGECEYVESLDEESCGTLDEEDFVETLQTKENYNIVLKEIYKMKEIYSFTLSYRFCDGMEVADIANLMGVSEKAIYSRIERGGKMLLEKLSKGGVSVV